MGGSAPGGLPLDLADAVTARADRLAAGLEALPGGPAGWRPCRLLFRNFWLFHREEFRFVHGRLFLRGANTSGKSTVLAAALPLLLDGSQVRHRLDTFGGTGRTLQYFLLGPDTADASDPDAFFHDQRTAYLALEFERPAEAGPPAPDAPRHLTIGMGLHCSRHGDARPVTFWGFLIRDGRRIGRDLEVASPEGPALRRQDLEALLGAGGTVVTGVAQYRALVDEALFGFGDPDAYTNLLQLLLELRAPKLNRDMGPGVVADLLAESLPPIDRGLFDQLQSILQRIDDYVDSCALLRRHHEAVARLDDAVALVQARRAEGASARYLAALEGLREARARLEAAEAERREADSALGHARGRASEIDRRREAIAGELGALRESEVLKAEDALAAARERARAAAAECRAAEERLREREGRLEAARRAVALAWDRRRLRGGALRDAAGAYARAAGAAEWPLGREAAGRASAALAAHWEVRGPEGAGGVGAAAGVPRLAVGGGGAVVQLPWLEGAAAERRERLQRVRVSLDERDAAAGALAEAEGRFRLLHERTREAREGQVQAERARADAGERAAEAVLEWRGGLRALEVPAAAAEAAAQLLRAHADPQVPPARLLGPVREAVDRARAAGEDRRRRLGRARDAAAEELAAKDAELGEWEARTEAVPPRSAAAAEARAALAAAGIAARPFYEAYDLDPGLPADSAARIEAAAEQAGLLDALVLAAGDLPRAAEVLGAAHLADTWVLDPDAAASALGAASGFTAAGSWRQGWLGGRAAAEDEAGGARYFGAQNRRRRHRERLEQLRAERERLAEARAAAEAAVAAAAEEGRRADLEAAGLDLLGALGRLAQATAIEARAAQDAKREAAALEVVDGEVRAARARRDACEAALDAAQAQVPESRGRSRQGIDGLLDALGDLVAAARGAAAAADDLAEADERVESRQQAAVQAAGDHEQAAADVERAGGASQREEAAVRALERLLDSPEGRADRGRYRALMADDAALQRERVDVARSAGALENRLAGAETALEQREAAAAAADGDEAAARGALEAQLGAYPSLALRLAALRSGPSGPEDAARDLLGRRAADATLARRIEADERAAERTLGQAEFESREVLADYGPEFSAERGLVRFLAAGPSRWPSDLRQDLEGRLLLQEQLLRDSERELYEEFILGQMRDSIHGRIRDAQAWVDRINADLENAPLGSGEVLQLRWSSLPAHSTAAGSTIARHVGLLLRDPGVLPVEEREALAGAFREEVERVRRREREEVSDLGFAGALERALDYRRWFRFEIVSRAPHQRAVELDDRRFSTRSGAEKSLALMLPLAAAAAARYGAARPDAPRLIGFDEAFAGVDPQNVGEALRFLCRFGFCWIMASERLWGVGEALPAAATYELVRRGNVAGALPFLWDGSAGCLRDVTAEVAAAAAGRWAGGSGADGDGAPQGDGGSGGLDGPAGAAPA